jgi:predicted DNA-binding transcriptional regulator YafY
MRYERVDHLLQLTLEMQAKRGGISLQDIQSRFTVGRRTAMRMRDAVLRNFPQAEELHDGSRSKRWRIPAGVVDRLVSFKAEELADLEAAAALFRAENQTARAESIERTIDKLQSIMKPESARRLEPDLEALSEAEGIARRPGPKPLVKDGVVDALRYAIKACRQVTIRYRNRRTNKVNERLVYPYGFLHGHRHYLVGHHVHPKANKVALFSLPNIEEVIVREDGFEIDPDFSLKAFADRSFGVFQEEPFDVVWKFSKDVAANAAEFEFHPTQSQEIADDGSLVVRFRAGGDLEMAWHLYVWGDKVEVLEPKKLADMVHAQRISWPAMP